MRGTTVKRLNKLRRACNLPLRWQWRQLKRWWKTLTTTERGRVARMIDAGGGHLLREFIPMVAPRGRKRTGRKRGPKPRVKL